MKKTRLTTAFAVMLLDVFSLPTYSCQARSTVLEWITEKIKSSDNATLLDLNCSEKTKISKLADDSIIVTSGRSRGRYTICLSNSKDSPCAYQVGYFNSQGNPQTMLSNLFGITPPKSKYLNETVERLFVKPSSLIR